MGNHGFVRSAGIVSACTLLSRLLGLARDILGAHFFGALKVMDAFALAFAIPNLFRRLFGEGALTAAFLPAFVERYDGGRREEAHALLGRVVTGLMLFLGLLTAAGIGLTWLLPGDEKSILFARLLRIMLPYLVLICAAAILGAALNGLRHYFTPAFAPVLLNVVWIAALFAFRGNIEAVAWAVVAGGVLELLVLLPALRARQVPVRPRLGFLDPAVREVGGKFLPMVFGLAVVQINEVVARVIAELFVPGDGAVSAIYYGNQLTQFPLALIGTAMATAVFPLLASPKEDFQDVFQKSLRLVLFVSLPATAGLMVLAGPIVALIYEHGRFTGADTERVAGFVRLYAAGLWCYCANHIQVRAFYARKDTLTPVKVSAAMVALNLTLNLALVGPLQERGIALSNAATGLATFVLLNVMLRKRHGGVDLRPVGAGFIRALAATLLMAGAVWGVHRLMAGAGAGRILLAAGPVLLGIGLYFLLAKLFRMDELRLLLRRPHENR